MTLAKIEGVSSDVFIPDEISREDKEFLLQRTENIAGIVTRAKVDIGLEFRRVENHFRDQKEFNGPRGWYQEWYKSLGFTDAQKQAFVNASHTIERLQLEDPGVVNSFSNTLLCQLSLPSHNTGGKDIAIGGTASETVDYIVRNRSTFTKDSEAIPASIAVKKTSTNQLLGIEEFIPTLEVLLDEAVEECSSDEYKQLSETERKLIRTIKSRAKDRLTRAQEKLDSLQGEKKALEAKYEDWRSPEAIKQEFDEAIEKARAEERAKKEATKQPETIVKEVQDPELLEEIERLKQEQRYSQKAAYEANQELGRTKAKLEQELKEAAEKLERAEQAKRSAQKQSLQAKEDLGAVKREEMSNDPFKAIKPMYRAASIHCHITEFKTACDQLRSLKHHENRSGQPDELDELAIEAMGNWIKYFSPEMLLVLEEMIQQRYTTQTISNTQVTIDV